MDAVLVDRDVGRQPALGGEGELAGVARPEAGDRPVRGGDEGVLDLVDVLRRGLVVGRRGLAVGAGAAAELELVVGPVVEDARVVLPGLEVQLGVIVLELGLVELAALDDVADVADAVGAPDPQVVVDQRSADVGAVLQHLVDPVAVGQIGLGLQVAGGVQVAGVAPPLVGAALGDLVDRHPRGLHGDVGARHRELDLLEGAEVEVGGRAAHRVHVGEDDAVHGEGVVAPVGAHADEVRLLAALVAADVDAVDQHAGRLAEQRPGIARRGHLVELDGRDVGPLVDPPLVEQRSLAGDGDDVLDRAVQGDLDVGLAAQPDRQARTLDRGETLQLGLEGVEPRVQVEEPELPLCVALLHLRRARAGDGDGHPRERLLLLIGHRAVEVARLLLREDRQGGHREQQQNGDGERETCVAASAHAVSPFQGRTEKNLRNA